MLPFTIMLGGDDCDGGVETVAGAAEALQGQLAVLIEGGRGLHRQRTVLQHQVSPVLRHFRNDHKVETCRISDLKSDYKPVYKAIISWCCCFRNSFSLYLSHTEIIRMR